MGVGLAQIPFNLGALLGSAGASGLSHASVPARPAGLQNLPAGADFAALLHLFPQGPQAPTEESLSPGFRDLAATIDEVAALLEGAEFRPLSQEEIRNLIDNDSAKSEDTPPVEVIGYLIVPRLPETSPEGPRQSERTSEGEIGSGVATPPSESGVQVDRPTARPDTQGPPRPTASSPALLSEPVLVLTSSLTKAPGESILSAPLLDEFDLFIPPTNPVTTDLEPAVTAFLSLSPPAPSEGETVGLYGGRPLLTEFGSGRFLPTPSEQPLLASLPEIRISLPATLAEPGTLGPGLSTEIRTEPAVAPSQPVEGELQISARLMVGNIRDQLRRLAGTIEGVRVERANLAPLPVHVHEVAVSATVRPDDGASLEPQASAVVSRVGILSLPVQLGPAPSVPQFEAPPVLQTPGSLALPQGTLPLGSHSMPSAPPSLAPASPVPEALSSSARPSLAPVSPALEAVQRTPEALSSAPPMGPTREPILPDRGVTSVLSAAPTSGAAPMPPATASSALSSPAPTVTPTVPAPASSEVLADTPNFPATVTETPTSARAALAEAVVPSSSPDGADGATDLGLMPVTGGAVKEKRASTATDMDLEGVRASTEIELPAPSRAGSGDGLKGRPAPPAVVSDAPESSESNREQGQSAAVEPAVQNRVQRAGNPEAIPLVAVEAVDGERSPSRPAPDETRAPSVSVSADRSVAATGQGETLTRVSGQATRVREARILDQVIHAARLQSGGTTSEIRVRLVPENLGEVHVRITQTQDGLTAEFRASIEATRDTLSRHATQLQAVLSEAGVRVEQVVVRASGSETFGDPNRQGAARDTWSRQGDTSSEEPPQERGSRNPHQQEHPSQEDKKRARWDRYA